METKKNETKQVQWGMSLTFLLSMMAFSILGVVLPIYMKTLGYTDTQVGFVIGMSAFVSVFGSFTWGVIDDRLKKTQKILQFLTFGLVLMSFLLGIVKPFLLFLLTRMLFELFNSGFLPLSDKAAIEIEVHYKVPYNFMRLFGSLGYAVVLFPVLYLVDKYNNYFIMFICLSLCYLGAFLATKLLKPINAMHEEVKKDEQVSIVEGVKKIIKNPAFILVGAIYVVMQVINDASSSFMSIHIVDTLKGAGYVVSLAVFISAGISETPFMFFGPKIHKKLGWYKCVLFSAIFFLIRFTLEWMAPTWQIYLMIKLMHGIYITLLFGPMLMLVRRHVPTNLFSTALTLLVAIKGICAAILSPIIGWLSDVTGTTYVTFPIYIGGMIIAILLLLVYDKKYQAAYRDEII